MLRGCYLIEPAFPMTCCAGGVGGGGGGGKGDGKVFGTELRRVVCVFIYLFFLRSIFLTPTPAVITNLIPRRISSLSQGWHHGVTVARLPQQMCFERGEVMISPAEPWSLRCVLVSIDDFSYSAAMPRCTSRFYLKR